MFDPRALPYLAGEWVAAAIALAGLRIVWQRRARPGARGLGITLVMCAWWCLWHGLSLVVATLPGKVALADIWAIGAYTPNASFLLFAIEYRRQAVLPWRRSMWLFAPVALVLLAFWTNPLHYQFWTRTVLVGGEPFTRIGVGFGPAAWMFAAWSNTFLAIAVVLLVRVFIEQRGLYRRQVAIMLAAVAIPWASYMLFYSGRQFIRDYDITTLTLTVCMALMAWTVFGERLLEVVPMAHHLVIDGLGDAVVVVDELDRVVYANDAARLFARGDRANPAGQALAAAFPDLARAIGEGQTELLRGLGREQRIFDLRVTPVRSGPYASRGRVVVVHDETDRRQVGELRRSRQQVLAAEESLRRRIAEMLHGPVQSKLLSAWMRLGQCETRWAGLLPPDDQALMTDIRNDIDRIREEDIRRASHLLHPAGLRMGLLPAVDYLAGGFEDFFRVDVTANEVLQERDGLGRDGLGEELRLVAYRAVEEALNNAAKHAQASRVDIRLGLDDGFCRVTVSDNGRGFDAVRVRPGYGFYGIASRVEQCGGTWDIESAPGHGTTLTVSLPLKPGEEREDSPPVRYTDAVSSR